MQYLFFCSWPVSLSTVSQKFILWPVARLPSFLRLNDIPLSMHTAFCLFICRAHLGFYFSVTVNKAAVNTVHV